MKKHITKIVIVLVIIVLMLGVFAFTGNPISWALVKVRSQRYLDEQFPEIDLRIDSIIYDFKHGGFYVKVSSPHSIDTHFEMLCDGFGAVQYDRYDDVSSGANTVARHEKAYQELVSDAFQKADAPFSSANIYASLCTQAGIEYYTVSTENGTEFYTMHKDFSLDFSQFQIDADYDLASLGAAHGQIMIFAQDEEISIQRMAELLLELRSFLDAQGVSFYAVEFSLSPLPQAGSVQTDEDTIHLCDFLYSDIYAEKLTDRVTRAYGEYLYHQDRMK